MKGPPSAGSALTLSEAAGLLQLDASDVDWLIRTKQLPSYQGQQETLIRKQDIRRLVETYRTIAHRRDDRCRRTR